MAKFTMIFFDVIGIPEFQQGMKKLIKKAPHFAFSAMRKGCLAVVAQAKENAPVKSGTLRESLRILREDPSRGVIHMGSTLNYAYWQEVGTSKMEGRWFFTNAVEQTRTRFKSLLHAEMAMLRYGKL